MADRLSRWLPVSLLPLCVTAGCSLLPFGKTTVPTPTPAAVATPMAAPTPTPFSATVFEPMSPLAQSARVPVIMYHDIIKERGRGSVYFDTTKQEFADQIGWLEEQGASFISLEQLHRHLTRGEVLPPSAVALTFDDNYQGFHDNAYPLLKEKRIPAAVFVHTNFVGDKKGTHPKMTWETLLALDKEGLITVGSHTLSHPEDMAKLPLDDQERELTESKALLEQHLGHPIPYFAYPSGTGDQQTFDAAQHAGYTMAFTMHNGPAEESPGILTVNRYIQTRLKNAWEDARKAEVNAPAAVVDVKLAANPVLLQVAAFEGVKLGMVRGGTPATWRTPTGRASVGEFIQQAASSAILSQPAVAGMNGTFFADAALRGTDNAMIGPCLTRADATFYPEVDAYRLPKLLNRPLVLWGPSRLMIVPFNPQGMNDEATIKALMPDVTDVFLAGAWIVHDGQPRTKEEMGAYSARDFNDPRRRAFFGITDSGDVVLGGTLDVVTTEAMAKAAAAAGVKEAVLMDSGFSTSIVYDGKIVVTGHTAKDLPSRPVPHAIVVTGTLSPPTDPETADLLTKADEAVGAIPAAEAQANAPGPSSGSGAHGRRRHR